jgi:hypothetical protein
VNESIGPGLGVIYHFSRQYREQAMQIDLGLRSVLEAFRKSSQSTNGVSAEFLDFSGVNGTGELVRQTTDFK